MPCRKHCSGKRYLVIYQLQTILISLLCQRGVYPHLLAELVSLWILIMGIERVKFQTVVEGDHITGTDWKPKQYRTQSQD